MLAKWIKLSNHSYKIAVHDLFLDSVGVFSVPAYHGSASPHRRHWPTERVNFKKVRHTATREPNSCLDLKTTRDEFSQCWKDESLFLRPTRQFVESSYEPREATDTRISYPQQILGHASCTDHFGQNHMNEAWFCCVHIMHNKFNIGGTVSSQEEERKGRSDILEFNSNRRYRSHGSFWWAAKKNIRVFML